MTEGVSKDPGGRTSSNLTTPIQMTPTYKATSPRKLKGVPSRLKFKGVLLMENNNLRIREEEARRLKLWCEGERKVNAL
jgi:hypothetical protein